MAGHSRALALDDVAEDLGGELLALVVADDTDLNLLVVAEILVVVHLAGHEGIGTGCDGVGQEEVACSTAERHLGKRPLQQLVGHNALHAKLPLEQADEVRYIEKALTEKEDEKHSAHVITVRSGGSNRKVILSEIVYAEIFDRRIILHMKDRDNVDYNGRISELESISGQDFFRVHRAYLINLAYVKSYDSKSVRVGDAEIPVARGKYQDLIKAYLSYYTRREGL